jgi:tetratricopeptide (TPR) repeat protein
MGAEAGLAYIRAASASCDIGMHTSVKSLLLRAVEAFATEDEHWAVLPAALLQIGQQLSFAGMHCDGLEIIRLALQLAVEPDDVYAIHHARTNEGIAIAASGDIEAAVTYIDDMRALCALTDEPLDRCRWTGLAGALLVEHDQHERARALLQEALAEGAAQAEPEMMSDLLFHDAQALWGLGQRDDALAKLADARDQMDQCDPELPSADARAYKLDYQLGLWMIDEEQWSAAEVVWSRMLERSIPAMITVLADRLAHALLLQERFDEVLTLLDSTPDTHPDTAVLGGYEWLWRQYLRAAAVSESGRWHEADALAENALLLAEPESEPMVAGLLWDIRALAHLDIDLDVTGALWQRAFDAYRLGEDATAMDEIVEQMRNLATLAASQWDRRQSSGECK